MYYWNQIEYNLYGLFEWDELLMTFKNYDDIYSYCRFNSINAQQR